MISVKNIVKANKISKFNEKDVVIKNINNILGTKSKSIECFGKRTKDNIDYVLVKCDKKWYVITLGLSLYDFTVINDDLNIERNHYELLLKLSNKEIEDDSISKNVEKLLYVVTQAYRKNAILPSQTMTVSFEDGVHCDKEDKRKVGFIEWKSEPISEVGRVGNLRFMQVVVSNDKENEILEYIDDTGITRLYFDAIIKDNKDKYDSSRTKVVNFAEILPTNKINDENINKFKTDKNGVVILDSVCSVSSLFELYNEKSES